MFKIMSVGASLISAWRLRNLGVTGWDELLAPRQLQRTPVTSGAQTPHSTLKESAFWVRAHLLHRMFSRILVWIILSPMAKCPGFSPLTHWYNLTPTLSGRRAAVPVAPRPRH